MGSSNPAVTRTESSDVPFLDLATAHGGLKDAVLADIADLIDSGGFTNGPQVAEFERAFAEYCGAAYAVGVSSGLDALRLGLVAAGIEPGDEVVVPANTFVASFEAITQAGGVPRPVDVATSDYNLDPAAVEAAMTPRTRFILPVHLYGQVADMAEIEEIARRTGTAIVEDACQAHGAVRDGRTAGTTGIAGAFSFYPGKNLGAMGDAGALVTNDAGIATTVRALREHGQTRKYEHRYEGWTARLDTVQAIVLLHKLPHLAAWNAERRAAAAFYSAALDGVGDLRLPPVPGGSDPVWHLYVVRTADPEGLAEFLREHGIGTGRHYPKPTHLSPAYEYLGYGEGSFPVAEALSREVVSLPIFPGITDNQVAAVVGAMQLYFDHG